MMLPQATQLLFEAARQGDLDGIRQALGADADIDALEMGVDPDNPDETHTPLSLAARHGRREAFDLLVDAGADRAAEYDLALLASLWGGALDIAGKLLESGADPDADGGAPLIWAIDANDAGTIRMLMAYGADWRPARGYARDRGDRAEAEALLGDPRLIGLSDRRRAERLENRKRPRTPLREKIAPRGRPPKDRRPAAPMPHRGNDNGYLAAKLMAEAPAFWADYQAGKYRTPLAALVAAGLRTSRVSVASSPEGFERSARKHLSAREIKRLAAALAGGASPPEEEEEAPAPLVAAPPLPLPLSAAAPCEIEEAPDGTLKPIHGKTFEFELLFEAVDGAKYLNRSSRQTVITSAAREGDGRRWLHVSTSFDSRLPSWRELRRVKDVFIGRDACAYQVLPPRERHVNIHKFCLHLFHCLDGEALPDFTRGGSSI